MLLPPFDVGAVKLTVAWELPAVADTAVGAPGAAYGVTAEDAGDAAPVPARLVAVTVKVYAVPFVNPETIIGLVLPVPVKLPGVDVTV